VNTMSAFLCEDKTINQIISFIDTDSETSWPKGELAEIGFIGPYGQELGKAMFNLNCRSLAARYSEDAPNESGTKARPYKFQHELCTRLQAYKSLRCFLYQACEGDTDNEPLYQALDKIANRWAGMIVSRLPAYEKAEWG